MQNSFKARKRPGDRRTRRAGISHIAKLEDYPRAYFVLSVGLANGSSLLFFV